MNKQNILHIAVLFHYDFFIRLYFEIIFGYFSDLSDCRNRPRTYSKIKGYVNQMGKIKMLEPMELTAITDIEMTRMDVTG